MADNQKSKDKSNSSHSTQRDRTGQSSTPETSIGERSISRRQEHSPHRSRPRSVVARVGSPKHDAGSKRKVTFDLPSSPRHARRCSDSSYSRGRSSYSRSSRERAHEHSPTRSSAYYSHTSRTRVHEQSSAASSTHGTWFDNP